MKILKDGVKKPKYFYCEDCGCVFEAEKSECNKPSLIKNFLPWTCDCPCCGEIAFEIGDPNHFM